MGFELAAQLTLSSDFGRIIVLNRSLKAILRCLQLIGHGLLFGLDLCQGFANSRQLRLRVTGEIILPQTGAG
jgi:hypothetical protein